MPKRKDIRKILIIGSGPIVIGQGCEFDYSGAQACKVLKQEGFKVVLVNSNPATIMTDPEIAYRTYIEPITPEIVEKIIRKEKPDSLLPTLGGQTGLNTAVALAESGVLKKYNVKLVLPYYVHLVSSPRANLGTCRAARLVWRGFVRPAVPSLRGANPCSTARWGYGTGPRRESRRPTRQARGRPACRAGRARAGSCRCARARGSAGARSRG